MKLLDWLFGKEEPEVRQWFYSNGDISIDVKGLRCSTVGEYGRITFNDTRQLLLLLDTFKEMEKNRNGANE